MSSILRALKKLEEDGGAKTGVQEDLITRPGGRSRSARKTLIGALAGIFIAASVTAVVIMLSRNPGGVLQHPAPQPGAAPHSLAENTSKEPVPAATPEKMQVRTQPRPQPRPPRTNREAARQAPAAAPMMPKSPAPAAKAPPNRTPAQPPQEMEAPVIPPSHSSPDITNIIKDDNVDLQAISWNPDKEKRIAVINGLICHEGDLVGEYTVKQIDPDDVVLSRGGMTGKILFK